MRLTLRAETAPSARSAGLQKFLSHFLDLEQADRLGMIAEQPTQGAVGSAPRKRSLFNKPSWSKPQALSNDTDLFHRSNQAYADLAAEAERARKRKLARKERERARQNVIGERAGKRRRVSEDEDEDDEDDDSSSDESSSHSSRKEGKASPTQPKSHHVSPTISQKPIHSPKSLLKRYEAKVAASKVGQEQKQKQKVSDIIDLEDEEDSSALPGQDTTWSSAIVKPAAPPEEDDQPVSDEEFPELARQAREKARRKRLEEDIASTTVNPQEGQVSLLQPMPPTSQPDPILQILITSRIDNTIPLIVSRRVSQRLKDVRLAWANRQNFTTDFTDTVFLTWRGKRVFDVTTCRSLGITVDAMGRISTTGGSWEEEEGQIHMEAMTAKILEAYKKAKRSETTGQEDSAAQEEAVAVQDHETQVRIVLKAKGLDDFKLQVRPVRHWCVDCLVQWLTSVSLLSSLRSLMLFVLGIRLVEIRMSSCPLMESDYRLIAGLRKRRSAIWTLLRFTPSSKEICIRNDTYPQDVDRCGRNGPNIHSTAVSHKASILSQLCPALLPSIPFNNQSVLDLKHNGGYNLVKMQALGSRVCQLGRLVPLFHRICVLKGSSKCRLLIFSALQNCRLPASI